MTPEQFGPYLLLKKLAEDPLGEVFRAGRIGAQGMEQVVLLRVFNGSALEGHDLATLIAGKRAIQDALKSPNIGNGVDLGQIQGLPYAAYDYISGKSLRFLLDQVVKRSYPVPADHALLIAERLALGLAVAYETRNESDRILHGFLVPHLVMLSNEGENKILGFEVGQGLRQLASKSANLLDTFGRYLSPEVRSGSSPARTDDIYSLGVILLELLLGHAPPPISDGVQGQIQRVVDQGAPEVAKLIQRSLAPAGERIPDIVTWHKTLSKVLVDGHHKSTTFNLAFFMHSLFRDEIERESQELEAERRIEVYARRPPAVSPLAATAAAEPWSFADSAEATRSVPLAAAATAQEAAPRFDPIPSPDRPGSASGAIIMPPLQPLPPLSSRMSGVFPVVRPPAPQAKASGRPILVALGLAIGLVGAGAGSWWLWEFLGSRPRSDAPDGQQRRAAPPLYTPFSTGAIPATGGDLEGTSAPVEGDGTPAVPADGLAASDQKPAGESTATDPLVRQLDGMVEERTRAVEAALRAQYDREIQDLRRQIEEARGTQREPGTTQAPQPAPAATSASPPPDARAATRPITSPAPASGERSDTATEGAEGTPAQSPAIVPASPPPAGVQDVSNTSPADSTNLTSRTPRVRRGELVVPGSGVVPPRLLREPKPRYPEFARRTRREGVVAIEVLVDENGLVRDARVAEPVGFGFDEAALQAARKAEFDPATKDGVEVKMWTRIRIAFRQE